MGDLRCLTIRQPFASLIAAGAKTIETRGWRTSYRGWVAIHAGARRPGFMEIGAYLVEPLFEQVHHVDDCDCDESGIAPSCERGATTRMVLTEKEQLAAELPLGAVVAVARLTDCVPIHETGCGCTRHGIYAQVVPVGMVAEEILGLFEAGGKGVEHLDWSPSRLDCLADAHPRQQASFGDFRCGRWAWLLDDIRPLADPIPARGRQGLWTPDPDLAAAIVEQIPETATP